VRLLFVCPDMRTGGSERHWAALITELAGRGEQVKLVALADTGPFFEDVAEAGVPAECLGLRRRTDPRGLRRALALAAEFAPDLVVTRGVSGQLVGEAIARRARAVHVFNEHTPLTPAGRLVPARPNQ
jgi:Glycosyl transferase 4-like domain